MKTRIRIQTKYQSRQSHCTWNPKRHNRGRKAHGLLGSALAGFGLLSVVTGASGQGVPLSVAQNVAIASYAWVINTGASTVNGNIIALASVTMATGANLSNGRAIALNGSLTLDTNNVLSPALNAAAPGRFWNGSASNLWLANNWSSAVAGLDQVALGSGADVVFSVNPAPIHQNTLLDSNTTIGSLTVNDAVVVTIGGLITYLDGRNPASSPDMYNSLMPADLTAIFQIGFAGADMRNSNIERHLELVRQAPEAITAPRPTISSNNVSLGLKYNF